MQFVRLFSTQALQAGILSGGVRVDTVQSASPLLHPAIVPNSSLNAPTTYTAPQVFANASGIAPTAGTNTQTGKLNRSSGNAWASLVATGGPASPQVGLMATTQYGDWFTLVPPVGTLLVQIQLAGMLQSGMGFKSGDKPDGTHTIGSAMVRNGAKVAVAVDTSASVVYDTYNQTVVVSTFLPTDGAQHAVLVQHSGLLNAAVPIISGITASTGTTAAANLTVGPTSVQSPTAAASSPIAALWTITVLAGLATFTLQKTPAGGSISTVGTFSTNTLYDLNTMIPGVAFQLNGTPTLHIGDVATFYTDASYATVESVSFYTASGSTAGVYQTPIMDSGNPQTQWFLYEHAESFYATNPTTSSVSALVGNTLQTRTVSGNSPTYNGKPAPVSWLPLSYLPNAVQNPFPSINATGNTYPQLLNANPDSTSNSGAITYSSIVGGTSTALTMSGVTLPYSGERRNAGGLMTTPVGQYCQFTISLTTATVNVTNWARDFRIWNWIPSPRGNPMLLAKFKFPPNWVPGPNMQAYFGSLLTFTSEYFAQVYDFNNSFTPGSAVDNYLLAKGADLGQPAATGEPTSAYQGRLANFVQAKSTANAPTTIVTTGVGTLTAPLVTVNGGTGVTTISPVSGDQSTIQSMVSQIALLINGVAPVVSLSYTPGSPYVIASGGGISVTQLGNRGVSISLPNPPYAGLPGLATGTTGGVDNPAKAIIKAFCNSLMPAGSAFNAGSSTYLNFNTLG